MAQENKEKKLKKVSKKSLKTMQKNRSRHIVREKTRVIKYGTKGFGRNIWLSMAATIVMSFTLIILFVTIVASVILTNTAEMMKDKIDITIYFKPETSLEDLEKLTTVMSADSNVKEVMTSTSEEEYQKLLQKYIDDESIMGVLDDEEMETIMVTEKMHSTMRIKVYDVDDLSSIEEIVEEDELFKKFVNKEQAPTYDVNRAEIATITSWARIARTGGVILAIVFLIVSVLIIFSTIRMAIFSRREEIYMMKLVGADKSFIRGPFLVEAEISGIVAGVVAGVVSYFGFSGLAPKLAEYGINVEQINQILKSNQLVLVFVIFIIAGMVIGRVSAHLAVSRYLKKM